MVDEAERNEIGLFVSEKELFRRLGVPESIGRAAVRELEPRGFPPRQLRFGNRRYWPAVRHFLDVMNGLVEGRGYGYSGVPDGPETVPQRRERRRPSLEAAERRLAEDAQKRTLGPEAPEQERARFGYTDAAGNYRRIVAGLRAGQVRVTGPDGRKWTEEANSKDPALWHRKRKLVPRKPTSPPES